MDKTLDKFLGDVIKHTHIEVTQNQTDIAATSAKASSVFSAVQGGSAEWDSAYSITSGGGYTPVDSVQVDYTPVNYSVPTADVSGHLEGLDNLVPTFVTLTGNQTITDIKTFNGIINANSGIQLATSFAPSAHTEGTIYWDTDDGTLAVMTNIDGTVLQVGQETIVRVVNGEVDTLNNGEVVRIGGAQGNRPKVVRVNCTTSESHDTLGVVTSESGIDSGQEGYITIKGVVRGVNTSSWAAGDALFLGTTDGQLVNTEGVYPNHTIKIGYALNKTNNGSILVDLDEGVSMEDIHGMSISPLSSLTKADIISYNPDLTSWVTRRHSQFTDTIYLRYNAISGTQDGETGCTLLSPSAWQITLTNYMYYIDPRDAGGVSHDMTIVIPDAYSGNLDEDFTFRKPNLAGDLGTVSLSSVNGQNIGPSPTFHFNHPSDFVQIIANEFEFGVGGYKWRQTYDKRHPAQTITVDPNGYQGYSSIQAAIDAIQDANSYTYTKTYNVDVHPGIYQENIVLKDGVNLRGIGTPWDVKIQPVSGINITWGPNSTYSHISNIYILGHPNNPGDQRLIVADNGIHYIKDCAIDWFMSAPSASNITCISADGTSTLLEFDTVIGGFYQSAENAITGCHNIFARLENLADIYISDSNIKLQKNTPSITSGSTVGEEWEFLSDNSSFNNVDPYFRNNDITVTVDCSAYQGDMYAFEIYNDATPHILGNSIKISGTTEYGTACLYKSKGGGSNIHSSNNSLEIFGFGTKYIGIIPVGDTLNSHYDDTNAISELSGAGTFNYVYSPNDGQLEVSDNLTVQGSMINPILSGDNTLLKSDSNGIIKDTTVSITDGPTGGSILNLTEFSTDPPVSALIGGDMWVLDSPSTTGKLWKYWDGSSKYSVELSKE